MLNTADMQFRFWSKVVKGPIPIGSGITTRCWDWDGAQACGYGAFWDGTEQVYAHRAAYELAGFNIPEGKYVMHMCDRPLCVRPDHLVTGTHQENMDRKTIMRRGNKPQLTPKKRLEICALYESGNSTADDIAAQYGVSVRTVYRTVQLAIPADAA